MKKEQEADLRPRFEEHSCYCTGKEMLPPETEGIAREERKNQKTGVTYPRVF